MRELGLLVGHLVGDYILQNDWMAKNKTNPYPEPIKTITDSGINTLDERLSEHIQEHLRYARELEIAREGDAACFLHCLLYTLAVAIFSFTWMPWWGYLVVFLTHYPVDRYRLPGKVMEWWGWQTEFKKPPFGPWSIVVVDNTWHLIVLYIIGMIATGVWSG